MKKFISLICCVAIIFSLTATISFAETTNFSVSVSATEVNVGDKVTVVLKFSEVVATSISGGFYFDKDLLTCESITDARGKSNGYLFDDDDEYYKANAFTDVTTANEKGAIGITVAGTGDLTYIDCDVATVEFTAKSAGTVNFSVYESTSGSNRVNVDGVNPVTLVIKGNEPVVDNTITNDDAPVKEGAKKTWSITAGNGVAGSGKTLVAKLTNTHADYANKTEEEKTQTVTLSFGEGVVYEGDLSCVFDVIVHFQSEAYVDSTELTVTAN